jgi:light-regulated signal transduction histidine kinase (bacteriophytochrome)
MPDMVSIATSQSSARLQDTTGRTQACGFVLEMSPDWLIMRASENAHGFLGEYPARLIGEPLSSFTLAQPLHDLRNSLSRQRSINGISRAYRTRLTDEPRYFDIAFQQLDGRILLEGLPSGTDGFGDSLGAVSRLIDGVTGDTPAALLDNAARRMRALTGFDRASVIVSDGGEELRAESARSKFAAPASAATLPALVADASAPPVGLFPAEAGDTMVSKALLRELTDEEREELSINGVRSAISVPLAHAGKTIGCFRCERRTPWTPSLELHAAAELFAQIVAIELERFDS